MATADPTADAELEECEEYRKHREILSQCFTEARQKLDEREFELSLQLKNLCRENLKKKKVMSTDIQQLINAMEHLKSTLSSNTLCETGIEAIEPIQKKIENLLKEEKTLLLNWSPQKLFHEIRNIGEYGLIPTPEKEVTGKVEILPETRTIPISLISPPPFDQQRTEIHSLLSRPFQDGQSWYLIHIRWFKQWKRFVGYDNRDRASAGDKVAKPGPIDNIPLIERGKLRRHQVDEIDYKLVPEEAWNKLVSWYGTVEGSEIKRYVVPYGKFVKQNKVEVYPLELTASVYPRVNEYTVVSLSRADTVLTLVRKVREAYNISSDKRTRIYNKHLNAWKELKDLSQEAQDVGIFDGQCVLLTIQDEDRSWPNPKM